MAESLFHVMHSAEECSKCAIEGAPSRRIFYGHRGLHRRKFSMAELDRIDRRILKELQARARVTNLELAAAVGLSPSACLQRVRRLEAAGIIGPYLAEIELDKVARSVTVIATVTLGSHRQRDFVRFEAAVA